MVLLTESVLFRIFIQGFYPDNHSVFFKYLESPNISLTTVYSSDLSFKPGTAVDNLNGEGFYPEIEYPIKTLKE